MATLTDVLAARTREGELYHRLDHGRVHCYACGHNCKIPVGALGVCKVRFNEDGRLMVPWGYAGGVQCDPIEKKPFFHVHPGARAYSFGMLGCDLHCGYCQNWVTSQALRDPQAVAPPLDVTPELLVRDAIRQKAKIVVSTYNEPLITSEWAVAIFKEAKAAGLLTGFVSNGNGTPDVLEYLRPHIDVYKVDLKSFDDRHYRELGGRLEPILDTIRRLHAMDVWLELVTLLIPGFNDSDDELKRMTEFIAGVSVDIPWHVTAFHADYKMIDPPNTTPTMLHRAAEIGAAAGLRYIYAGNLPGRVGDLENTRCPHCRETVVDRYGYLIRGYTLTPTGACPSCGTRIPGQMERRMIADLLGRPLKNLRLSVTDRCNLRCSYCMPEAEYVWLPRNDILQFEEMSTLVDVFAQAGVDRIRLTGGEPLLRRDLSELVRMLANKPAIRDLALTTNGVALADQARALHDAGLHRLTVSLDTLQPERFQALTRFNYLPQVLAGIDAALKYFSGIKIDSVIMRGTNEDELVPLMQYGKRVGAEVRFIEYMDVGGATHWSPDRVVARQEMLAVLGREFGSITPLNEGTSAPADRYRLPDGTIFGIISSTTEPFCRNCDRSRLTADGMWYRCLYATKGTDLRAPLRAGQSREELLNLITTEWSARTDRGAEDRLSVGDRAALVPASSLKKDPHLEMHTRGG